jgi:3-oxoacyl-[acyl-carrier protein] reductase
VDLGIEGKTALVAAASRGLGKAAAHALVAEGVRVMITARDADVLEQTRSELAAGGGEVEAIVEDVTDPLAPARMVAATRSAFGQVDIVIANSGGPPPGKAFDVDDAALQAALNANLLSSIRLAREALPSMRERGWGRICCIASYSIVEAIPALALSTTARAGLHAWAKGAAQDLAHEESGVTLNVLCPGPHATDRMRELGGAGVMGDPADFGRIVAFLCSQSARFVNGIALVVDGGETLAL